MERRSFCIDLDGTLCTNTWGEYERAEPVPWAIERVNALHDAGHRILIYTARGATTGIDWTDATREQLTRWGVRYDELRLGKPGADVYVDDRALHVDAWRYEHSLGLAIRAAGMRRHGEGPEFSEGPRLPPPHSSAAVVAGRTFAGRPHDVAGVVARAASIADAAGVPHAHGPDEIGSAVEAALADPLARPEPGDDILFTVELTGLPGAVHLDVTEGGWSTGLNVSTRLLSQAAKGLARLWTRGGIRASSAGFSAPADSWPLLRTHGGFLDALGSDVVGEDEELVIAGVPFCALPVAELDGARLTGSGALYRRLVAEWCEVAGFDVAEQVRRLAGIEVPSPNPSSTG